LLRSRAVQSGKLTKIGTQRWECRLAPTNVNGVAP